MELTYSGYERTTNWNARNDIVFITFKQWDSLGFKHGFSTRLGGVSKGVYSSMNLSFTRGDGEEAVRENHDRFAKAVGYDAKRLVFSDQIHGNKIYQVTQEDVGKGIVKDNDIKGMDGLATNVEGVPLMTFYADCVPLYFYDQVRKVVAMAHSGWRGTVLHIGAKMVRRMKEAYGCRPEDIYAAIGPSICGDCYEVGEDVAQEFRKVFSHSDMDEMIRRKNSGKYWIDLWKANEILLLQSGIQKEKLSVTDLCTCHNPEVFYSHRVSKGERGSLAAFVML